MAKKSTGKATGKPASSSEEPRLAISGDMRAHEKMMADLTHMLSQQDFASIEEANQFMTQFMAASGGVVPETLPNAPLEKAQSVMYQAWESPSRTQRLKLARKALEISPDCADAYVLLAEESAKTPAEASAFYEQGVKAGKRALKDEFEELKGDFWGFMETRPYMRARLGLAQCLWAMDELAEAAGHMDAMLELNPGDNQGVRYLYANLLLELEDSKRLEKLLKQYSDDWSASWMYSGALYEFRKNGRSRKADKQLIKAIAYNPHVPDYLLGKKKLSAQQISFYSPGDENEAIEYTQVAIRPWMMTPGALVWLREIMTEHDKLNPSF